MIRFKDKYYPEFNIDPETGVITDQNGVVQEVKEYRGYLWFRGIPVHRIQAHTWFGYYGSRI
jgi:hypothetical protein